MTPDTPTDDTETHRPETGEPSPDVEDVAAVIDAEELPRLARLESDDRVSRLDEERFVVSTDPETAPSEQATDRAEPADDDDGSAMPDPDGARGASRRAVSESREDSATSQFEFPVSDDGARPSVPGTDRSADGDRGHRPLDADAAFAVSIAAETPNGRSETTIAHDDIRETFAELLRWYATAVEPDRDPAAVLSVLLQHVDVETP